jgi:ATP-dependent Clp protease adaptor protein ClpS
MKNELNKEYTENLETLVETKEPPLFQILVHNDDFTPMEFVVSILERFFFMNRRQATEVMLEAHLKGKATCGLYTKDVAESKIQQVTEYARIYEHPLVCSMEAAA